MKFYNPNAGNGFYQDVPHNCNQPTDPVFPFIVNCRDSAGQRCGFSRDTLVFAKDADSAIANFLCNIVALGTELKKTLKPEDLLPVKAMVNDPVKLEQATHLRSQLSEYSDRFNDIFEKEGDLAEVERETLVEKMDDLRKRIADLEERTEKTFPSRFDRMMEKSAKLAKMHITAYQLDTQRAYAVSYFDDSRDYVSSAE